MKIAQLTILFVIIASILILLISLPGSQRGPVGEPDLVLAEFLSSYKEIDQINEWQTNLALPTVIDLIIESYEQDSYVSCFGGKFDDWQITNLTVDGVRAFGSVEFFVDEQVVSESRAFLDIVNGRWLVTAFSCQVQEKEVLDEEDEEVESIEFEDEEVIEI